MAQEESQKFPEVTSLAWTWKRCSTELDSSRSLKLLRRPRTGEGELVLDLLLDVTNWRIEEAFAIHLQLGFLEELSEGWIRDSPLTKDHICVGTVNGLQMQKEKVGGEGRRNQSLSVEEKKP